MPKYRCNLGHVWEAGSSRGESSCPRCGAPAKILPEGTVAIEPPPRAASIDSMDSATVDIAPDQAAHVLGAMKAGQLAAPPIARVDGTVVAEPPAKSTAAPRSDGTVVAEPPAHAPESLDGGTIDISPEDAARALEQARSGQTIDLETDKPRAPDLTGQTVDIAPVATQQRLRPDMTVDFSGGAPAEGSDRTGAWESAEGTQRVPGPSERTGGWGATEGGASGPAFTVKKDKQGPAAVGTRIAGYDILGELGRGGMGVVYKAKQAGLNRLVALKMIISGAHAGSTELARFRAEAESIAGLAHPNIVQVYEVGEHEGLPFFSLEFIDGKPLDRLIDGAPQEPKQAAKWFQQLADGMFAAHKNGIIHRDLKPANVLLTKDGVPKITDFGLAKRFEDGDSGNTRTGSILGTPSYMPPEQAAGKTKETGPPADIYSLGAIFYELLTGRPPFRGASPLETIKQVQKMDPVPPTRLQPSTPPDLETICLKCLEKEPAKRYATAGALAEDVRRFLNDEPILARPTPAWEVAWKWAKRNPEKAIAITTLAVSLLLLIGGGAWFTHHLSVARATAEEQRDIARMAQEDEEKARREEEEQRQLAEDNAKRANVARAEAVKQRQLAEDNEKRAVVARAEAEQQRGRAEANFKHAQDAVEQMLTRVGQAKLANMPHMEQVRKDLLRRALNFYLKFMENAAGNANLQHEAGLAQIRVGDIHEKLGEPEKAEAAYRDAIKLLDSLAKANADRADYRGSLAGAHNQLGILLQAMKRPSDAQAALAESLKLKEEILAREPNSAEAQADLAASIINQGNFLGETGKLPEAIAAFRRARAMFSQLAVAAAAAKKAEFQREASRAGGAVGVLLINDGKYDEAEKLLRATEAELVPLAAQSKNSDDQLQLGRTRFNLATLMQIVNRPAEADQLYRGAGDTLKKLTDEYPDVVEYRQLLADLDKNRGVFLRDTKRQAAAEPVWREAVTLYSRLSLEFPKDATYRFRKAEAQNEHAIALVAAARYDEAELMLREASAAAEKLIAAPTATADMWRVFIDSRANLSSLLGSLGRAQEEIKTRQALIAVLEPRCAAVPGDAFCASSLGQAHKDQAIAFFEANRLPDAVKALREAIRRQRAAVTGAPTQVLYLQRLADHHNALFEALLRQGDHAALSAAVAEFTKDIAAGPAYALPAAALARAHALAEKDDKLAPEKRKELAQAHAAQSIALLRQAAQKGYKDAEQLRKSPAFESLRSRDDFKKLLDEMTSAGKTPAP